MGEVTVPQRGPLLGVDFGTRRVGLAVCDTGQAFASPLQLVQRQGDLAEVRQIRKLCEQYGVRGLVVGLPVHMSGDEGQKAREARAYGERLAAELSLPVTFWDERFTSQQAEAVLLNAELSPRKRKQRIDMVAATLLLQSFLDAADRSAPPASL